MGVRVSSLSRNIIMLKPSSPQQTSMLNEIQEQPAALRRTLTNTADAARQVALEAQQRNVDLVILAARGTSDHAALYAQYLFQYLNGIPVALATPSLYTLYGITPRLKQALVIGISQSGESTDIVEVVAVAVDDAADVVGTRVVRVDAERFGQVGDGAILLALVVPHVAAIGVGDIGFRIVADRVGEISERAVEIALLLPNHAAHVIGARIFRVAGRDGSTAGARARCRQRQRGAPASDRRRVEGRRGPGVWRRPRAGALLSIAISLVSRQSCRISCRCCACA